MFALLYVAAQAIERLLEPFSRLFSTASAAADRDAALAKFQESKTLDDGQKTARAQALLDKQRANRSIVFWAAATILGMGASGWLRLYVLHIVGVTDAPRLAEILVTGLVIGGGTKPLHDLISRIEKAKNKAQDPPETSSGS